MLRPHTLVPGLLIGALIAAAASTAAPTVDRLQREVDRATAAETRADSALARQQAALVATRAELDAARTRLDARAEALTLRLRDLYARPRTTPLLALVALDPSAARARNDLADAVARSDAELVGEARRALAALQVAETRLEDRRRSLLAAARVAAAKRARATARLQRVRAPRRPPTAGETVAGVTRGLPIELVLGRALPGESPLDAETGIPLVYGSAPSPPEADRIPRRMTITVGWYSPTLRLTASGAPFDPAAHTAAHRTLPFGTRLLLRRGDRRVTVTINDRGPFVPGRELDLTPAAAATLGLRRVTALRAELVTPASGDTAAVPPTTTTATAAER